MELEAETMEAVVTRRDAMASFIISFVGNVDQILFALLMAIVCLQLENAFELTEMKNNDNNATGGDVMTSLGILVMEQVAVIK